MDAMTPGELREYQAQRRRKIRQWLTIIGLTPLTVPVCIAVNSWHERDVSGYASAFLLAMGCIRQWDGYCVRNLDHW